MRINRTVWIDDALWNGALKYGKAQIPAQTRNQIIEQAVKSLIGRNYYESANTRRSDPAPKT